MTSTRLRSMSVVLALVIAGCGMEVGAGPSFVGRYDEPPPPTLIAHEPCDTAGASAHASDATGDGKPDTVHVLSGGAEACRAIDFDQDGRPDTYVYFDPNGKVRRQERDTNHDGTIDEVAHFREGVVEQTMRDTNGDGKADTWDYAKDGKLVKRLHDANANGKVDQWWTWLDPSCPTVATDRDDDGKPDFRRELCKASAAASASSPRAP